MMPRYSWYLFSSPIVAGALEAMIALPARRGRCSPRCSPEVDIAEVWMFHSMGGGCWSAILRQGYLELKYASWEEMRLQSANDDPPLVAMGLASVLIAN